MKNTNAKTPTDHHGSVLLIEPSITKFKFDDAVELAGHGRFHFWLLLGTGIGCMCLMVEENCMAFVIPSARCDLQLSTRQQGFLYAATTFGFVCSSHIWGFIADTWGRRKVLRRAMLLCCITSAFSSLSPDTWTLVVGRFVVGLCLSGIKGSSMSYLSEFHSARMRPFHLSLLSSFIMSSTLIQALLALVILRDAEAFHALQPWLVVKSWRVFILAGSSISGLGAIAMYWLPESPKFLLSVNQPERALDILKRMFSINTGRSEHSFPVKELTPLDETGTHLSSVFSVRDALSLIWAQTKPLLLSPHRLHFLLCCTFSTYTFFVVNGLIQWFPQILNIYSENESDGAITTCAALRDGFRRIVQSKTNSTTAEVSVCTATLNQTTIGTSLIFGCCLVFLNTAVGITMKRVRPKYLQTLWFSVACLAALSLNWGANFRLNVVLMIMVMSVGASIASICGVFGDLFPTHLRSMALNLIMMCGRLGSVAGSVFLASTIYWHCTVMLDVFAAVLAAQAVIVWIVCSACEQVRNK